MLHKNLIKARTQMLLSLQARHASKHLKAFATLDPNNLSPNDKCSNLVNGEWVGTEKYKTVISPLTGKPMVSIPDTQMHET